MSTLGAVGSPTTSIYLSPLTEPDATAATDPDKDAKPKTPAPAPPAAPQGSYFASALMSVLLDAQASGSDPDDLGLTGNMNASSLVNAQTGAQAGLPSVDLLGELTDSDKKLIAATGTTLPSDDQGADAQSLPTFVMQIAADRMTGRLTGDITPDYLQHLASLDASISQPIDPEVVASGIDYLNGVTT